MPTARFLKSTPFRLAVTFALLSAATFVVAAVVTYLILEADLDARLELQIKTSFDALEGLYNDGEAATLIVAIESLAPAGHDPEDVYLLQSAAGVPLAGNMATAPPGDGWSTAVPSTLGLDPDVDDHFYLYSGPLGDMRLTVGSSIEASTELLEFVLESFTWAIAVVLLGAIASGVLLALRAQRRIDLIAGTLNAVGQGRLDARIEITPRQDDLDHLSAQINAALDRLERLVEDMKQVGTDIAHDLKTPINRLFIAIEAAHRKVERGLPVEQDLVEAQTEAQNINDTFDALLSITQISAGARRLRFKEVELGAVLETVFDAYDPVAEEQGKKLRCVTDGEKIAVLGDRQLLIQMLASLVDNAIRHSPAGTGISLEASSSQDGGAEVIVADTGPGIPSAEWEKVFQRLYRLEKSRTTPGSGLGLSLVKAVADLHGADLHLSDNAPGLRVHIRFPSAQRKV